VRLFLELVGVGVLILLNAFFVAAEYGLVTARRTRMVELHHQGNRRARAVLRITSDPPQFIAAMQLGVTLTSLGIGALGEHALSKAFESWLATVLAAALAYELTCRRGHARMIVGALCAVCALKPIFELATGGPAFAMSLGPGVVQVPLAHAVGALVGIACGLAAGLDRRAMAVRDIARVA
jgi:hypothetical protein